MELKTNVERLAEWLVDELDRNKELLGIAEVSKVVLGRDQPRSGDTEIGITLDNDEYVFVTVEAG